MKAVLSNPGVVSGMEPLTCTRPLTDCTVANITLKQAQLNRLSAAGYDVGNEPEAGALCLFLAGNGWPSCRMLKEAASSSNPLTITDRDGNVVAWLGMTADKPDQESVCRADDNALFIEYPWHLLKVNADIVGAIAEDHIQGTISPDANIEGHITIGPGTKILSGVCIEGNVVIGSNCRIGPNCYLRSNVSIGDDCHIGHAVEIKNSIIMAGTHIAHLSYCGDSIIGERVNFGAGTITSNLRHDGSIMRSMIDGRLISTGLTKLGAIMGDNVHTGINTSIYPGRKIWPDQITLPGQIVVKDV